jgi:hypothetical protein
MAVTLPVFTKTMDNAFVTTWYDVRAEAIDNILNATPLWAILVAAGCMTPQVGGNDITRTIRYGQDTAVAVAKGDTLPSGEVELETTARWTWRTIAAKVQRDTFDDQKNRGPMKIKDYVGMRLTAARDALEQKYESNLLRAVVTDESGKEMQGLHDMIPPIASRSSGTYGGITRPATYSLDSSLNVYTPATGNTFWGPRYATGTLASIEDDLISDMKNLYGGIHNNQSAPNLIIGTKAMWDLYGEFALDISQIVKGTSTFLADLGFEEYRFNGKPFIYSSSMTANHMIMLNTAFCEIVYDPDFWFAMSEWKPEPMTTKRIAHILSFANVISDQLRRHGRLEYS